MELRNKNIVILGLARYNSEIESTTFTLAKHFAENNKVFYIGNPYTWKSLLLPKYRETASQGQPGENILVDTSVPNLKVVRMPRLMSINWMPEGKAYRTLLKVNELIMKRRIDAVLKASGIDDFVFINSYNFYYPGIGQMLNPSILVYHCVDPLVYDLELRHGRISEAKLVRESDVVICTSKQLYQEKRTLNKHTYFIPNAADIRHSSKALQDDLPVYKLVADIPGPRVGYFGNIERRIDYDLLDKVTAANPKVNFVFAGPLAAEFIPAWFYDRANVHRIGPVPYSEMPNVVKGFDVAMIPFKKDKVSATIFPLKLFEYLGAGKPVVATNFNPDLVEFTRSTVAYCDGPEMFSQAIRDALENNTQEQKDERIRIASENTWEKRSREFAALVSRYLDQKTGIMDMAFAADVAGANERFKNTIQ